MAKTRFQKALEDKIKEAVDKRSTQVVSGGCLDYPQYREAVGFITGLQTVLSICEDIEAENQ